METIKVDVKEARKKAHTKSTQSTDLRRRLQFEELMLEKRRQDLLKSDQAEERRKGQSMVTAASLFDHYGGEQHLHSTVSLGETASHSQSTPDSGPHHDVLEEALEHGEQEEVQDVDMTATLQPLLDQQKLAAKKTRGREKRSVTDCSSKASSSATWLWLPLTFKDVPKKGDWDVRRLKDSTYFFS